jgi:hypothetical protein
MGRLANTRELILLGADPMRPANKAGNTPLKDAQREKYEDVINFLKDYEQIVNSLTADELISKLETGMSYFIGKKETTISFAKDGKFYYHGGEIEGEWSIAEQNP